MNVLIVYAHPEPQSFQAAMRDTAAAALRSAGHVLQVSDLYTMQFDPVSDRRNFSTVADAQRLNLQHEESLASRHSGFVPALQTEIDKLRWCNLLVLQFPLWWLGMPAILKGWIDRVFALGVAYGGGHHFDTGVLRGKRAMCLVSVGGLPQDYDGSGAYADIRSVLYPIERGMLAFTGFEVLPPFVAYGPARVSEAQRRAWLDELREHMAQLPATGKAAPDPD
jgi:NAD(P)H dehydrogenase (quinone)